MPSNIMRSFYCDEISTTSISASDMKNIAPFLNISDYAIGDVFVIIDIIVARFVGCTVFGLV